MGACSSEFGGQPITVATNTSTVFDVGPYARGSLQFPSEITSANFSLLVSNDGVSFNALRDSAGALKGALPCSNYAVVPLPVEVFNSRFCKFQMAGAEGSPRSILAFLKF